MIWRVAQLWIYDATCNAVIPCYTTLSIYVGTSMKTFKIGVRLLGCRSHMISLDFILYNPSKDRKVNPTEHLQFHILQHPGWDSQRQRQDAASLSQILNWKLTTWRVMKSDPRNGWKLKPETIGNRRQPQLFGGGHLWFPVKISLKPIISIAFHQIDKDLDSWQILTV